MYLIDDGNGGAVAVSARFSDRLAARIYAGRIDSQLAQGASPDASLVSALRSRELISDRSRDRLASGLRRAMSRANDPWTTSRTGVSVNSAEINSAEMELLELERLLRSGRPLSVRGVAQVGVLLTTGSGPLYNPRTAANLVPYLRRAIEAMSVLPVSRASST